MAFLSLHQVRPGETAVIPLRHIDHFTDVSDDMAAHIMLVAQRIGRALRTGLDPDRIGYVVHGYGVPHAHLMVVPQHSHTDIASARLAGIDNGKVTFSISRLPQVDRKELDEMAERIKGWLHQSGHAV